MQQRYVGKPFLRLLELYVLWSVGELTADNDDLLLKMTPKFRELYKREGAWQEIIAGEMEFPPDLHQTIKALWIENKQRAENCGVTLEAEEFARTFVDQNFDTSMP